MGEVSPIAMHVSFPHPFLHSLSHVFCRLMGNLSRRLSGPELTRKDDTPIHDNRKEKCYMKSYRWDLQMEELLGEGAIMQNIGLITFVFEKQEKWNPVGSSGYLKVGLFFCSCCLP